MLKTSSFSLSLSLQFSLCVPLRQNLLVQAGGRKEKERRRRKKKELCVCVCVCVSFMEVAVDPVCLGILSDCLTDNPSHSQCVWQEEVSVNSPSLGAARTGPVKDSHSSRASPGTLYTWVSLEDWRCVLWGVKVCVHRGEEQKKGAQVRMEHAVSHIFTRVSSCRKNIAFYTTADESTSMYWLQLIPSIQ